MGQSKCRRHANVRINDPLLNGPRGQAGKCMYMGKSIPYEGHNQSSRFEECGGGGGGGGNSFFIVVIKANDF